MDTSTSVPSPQLLEANRRLSALRAQLHERRAAAASVAASASAAAEANIAASTAAAMLANAAAALPAHLGWHSAALTRLLRPRAAGDAPTPAAEPPLPPEPTPDPVAAPTTPAASGADTDAVAVDPTLLSALLRHDLAAPARIWLLARRLDRVGRGWLPLDDLRAALTTRDSPLRICGRRRLRQLLQQGGGVLWSRNDHGRLWLHGAARVAAALDVPFLQGQRVALPLNRLLGPPAALRAAFYAAFHAGRASPDAPIARATLADLTGVCPRSQRTYDRLAGVRRRANFALGGRAGNPTAEQAHAWQHGSAAFRFSDRLGRQGPVGAIYLARQLPNSYAAPLTRLGSGRRRSVNRQLRQRLVTDGAQGNGRQRRTRRYHADAAEAVQGEGERYLRLVDATAVGAASRADCWMVLR